MSSRRRLEKLEAEAALRYVPAPRASNPNALVFVDMLVRASDIAAVMSARHLLPGMAWPMRPWHAGPEPLFFHPVLAAFCGTNGDLAAFCGTNGDDAEPRAAYEAFQVQVVERYGDRDVFVLACRDDESYESGRAVEYQCDDGLGIHELNIMLGETPTESLCIEGLYANRSMYVRRELPDGDWWFEPEPLAHFYHALYLAEQSAFHLWLAPAADDRERATERARNLQWAWESAARARRAHGIALQGLGADAIQELEQRIRREEQMRTEDDGPASEWGAIDQRAAAALAVPRKTTTHVEPALVGVAGEGPGLYVVAGDQKPTPSEIYRKHRMRVDDS